MSSFTLLLGNLSHTLGTATSKTFQASGQQPCLCRRVKKGRGSDKLPRSTLGVRINHCTFKALRGFHQRCLWSPGNPGTTWMFQGNTGPCTSCLSLIAETTWLYYLLEGVGLEGALPSSPGWIPRHDYYCPHRAKESWSLLTGVGEIVDTQAPHWPHFQWWSLEVFEIVELLKHRRRQE